MSSPYTRILVIPAYIWNKDARDSRPQAFRIHTSLIWNPAYIQDPASTNTSYLHRPWPVSGTQCLYGTLILLEVLRYVASIGVVLC